MRLVRRQTGTFGESQQIVDRWCMLRSPNHKQTFQFLFDGQMTEEQSIRVVALFDEMPGDRQGLLCFAESMSGHARSVELLRVRHIIRTFLGIFQHN